MEFLTYQHFVGVFITLLLVIAAGIYAGSKIKDASDFMSGANKAKWQIITGTIIGILVGGSSTLGTVKWIICMGCRVGGLH